jgi:hypothetical protein
VCDLYRATLLNSRLAGTLMRLALERSEGEVHSSSHLQVEILHYIIFLALFEAQLERLHIKPIPRIHHCVICRRKHCESTHLSIYIYTQETQRQRQRGRDKDGDRDSDRDRDRDRQVQAQAQAQTQTQTQTQTQKQKQTKRHTETSMLIAY